jgi:hypothetical protein
MQATPDVGHRFLLAAHETFTLLAKQPDVGWKPRLKHRDLTSLRIFRVSGFEKMLVLYQCAIQFLSTICLIVSWRIESCAE